MEIAQEWLNFERDVLGQRPLISGSVEEVRAAYAKTSEMLKEQLPKAEEYNVVDSRAETDSGVPLRIYAPSSSKNGSELFPVGIFAHGGGHVNGGAWKSSFEDRMCRYIAHYANVVIVQVDFRLAPEHPVPTQIDDCVDAYTWCHNHSSKIHGDTTQYFSIGSSLGGGVALAVFLKLADGNKAHWVKGIVALAPALLHPDNVPEEYKGLYKSYDELRTGAPLQDGESMVLFYRHNGASKQTANPYVFPLLHPALKYLPPVYQAVCGADPVRDDSVVLKHVLDKYNVPNILDMYPGLPHYFWIFPALQSSEPFHANVAKGVKWILSLPDEKVDAGVP